MPGQTGASAGGLLGSMASSLPVLGPAISGVSSLLGGIFQGNAQQSSVQQQENYQTQMSDTAYQRSVADMQAAGLNPALMYGSGGPESSPMGANTASSTPNVLGGVAQSTMSTALQMAQIQNTMAQTKQTQASTTGYTYDNQEKELEGNTFKMLNTVVQPILEGLESQAKGPTFSGVGSSVEGLVNQGMQSVANSLEGVNTPGQRVGNKIYTAQSDEPMF